MMTNTKLFRCVLLFLLFRTPIHHFVSVFDIVACNFCGTPVCSTSDSVTINFKLTCCAWTGIMFLYWHHILLHALFGLLISVK